MRLSLSTVFVAFADHLRQKGGEGGIRTPGTFAGTPVFETGTFGRSVTSPDRD